MKIAFNALASTSGGGYTYLKQLLRHLLLINSKYNYLIFAQNRWDDEQDIFSTGRVEFISIPEISLSRRIFYEQVLLPKVIRQNKVDVLFSPAEVATLAAGIRQVLGIQNSNVYEDPGIAWPVREQARLFGLKWLARVSARVVDHIVFVSKTAQRRILKSLRCPNKQSSVVYHGIEVERFLDSKGTLNSRKKSILCVAAIERHKNLENLIKAYALLDKPIRRDHPLTIVGDISDLAYFRVLQRLARDLGVTGRVHFIGGVAFNKIHEYYHRARVFILPSLLETFGMPLIEAMAAGIPVVASDISCLPEICGEAALYFNPMSPSEMAAKITRLLEDENLYEMMRQHGIRRSLDFSWEKTAQQMLDIFESVMKVN